MTTTAAIPSTAPSRVLQGRRVLVAGGSRGIGLAIAQACAAAGADVAICARGQGTLDEAKAALSAAGGRVDARPCDLSQGDQIQRWVDQAREALGGIDVLVNNASGFGMGDSEAAWAAGLGVDVMAMVRASHAALPALGERPGGCILNISSISGLGPSTRSPAYAAAKAAMINYSLSQAQMLAPRRIRVNAIAPGSIEFPGGVWDQRKQAGDAVYANTLASIPFGRMGTAEEVAEVALFLVSPAARWVTGQVISVDGGQSL